MNDNEYSVSLNGYISYLNKIMSFETEDLNTKHWQQIQIIFVCVFARSQNRHKIVSIIQNFCSITLFLKVSHHNKVLVFTSHIAIILLPVFIFLIYYLLLQCTVQYCFFLFLSPYCSSISDIILFSRMNFPLLVIISILSSFFFLLCHNMCSIILANANVSLMKSPGTKQR